MHFFAYGSDNYIHSVTLAIKHMEGSITGLAIRSAVDEVLLDWHRRSRLYSTGWFGEYADKVFTPYLSKQLEHTTRIDIVWDTYLLDSLKECTWKKVYTETCQAMPNYMYLATGWTSSRILTTRIHYKLYVPR